jgi:excisionase family DNA binding protein
MEAVTITVDQVAKALRISRNAAYAGVKAGEIPSIRIGRRVLVPKIAFERMLAEAGQRPQPTEAA